MRRVKGSSPVVCIMQLLCISSLKLSHCSRSLLEDTRMMTMYILDATK